MEPEDLSDQQREILTKFRQQLGDAVRERDHDYNLSRWLIARSWNVSKAEKMYHASLEWRKLHCIDTIVETWKPPDVMKTYVPGGFCGMDRQGSPVWIEEYGSLDMKGLFASVRVKDLIRNRLFVLESAEHMINYERLKRKKHPGGITMVYDFENFGLKQLWKPGVDLVGELFCISETNYPELLKVCYILHAPKLFWIAYSLMKPFLHQKTREKVNILSSNWKEKLLEAIDADQLPVHWGGTQTDPDGNPYCRSKIAPGGDVPQTLYCNAHTDRDWSHLTGTVVNKGSLLKVELPTTAPNSVIRWQFLTDVHDVGFGVFRQVEGRDTLEEVVCSRRVNSHQVPEEGCVLAPTPGIYVVQFDNRYSWVNNKRLYYKLELLSPEQDKLQTDNTAQKNANDIKLSE